MISCHPVLINNPTDGHKSKRAQHYIELCLNLQDAVKRPLVRCSNEEMAHRASRHVSNHNLNNVTECCIFGISQLIKNISFILAFQINYAKSVYDERELTLNYETVMEN